MCHNNAYYRLYTFTNLQGSQTQCALGFILCLLYTFTNLQGSQTIKSYHFHTSWLYTFTNLQGSQTLKLIPGHHRTFTYWQYAVNLYYNSMKQSS